MIEITALIVFVCGMIKLRAHGIVRSYNIEANNVFDDCVFYGGI